MKGCWYIGDPGLGGDLGGILGADPGVGRNSGGPVYSLLEDPQTS